MRLAALPTAALLLAPVVAGQGAGHWVAREAFLMGTTLELRIEAPSRERGVEATEAVLRRITALEATLSTWRDDAELQRVNRAAPGRAVAVSAELRDLLLEAADWSRTLGGSFDPAVGALVDAWGVRGTHRRPDAAELASARRATGLRHFRIDSAASTVARDEAAAWLDSGGFGKGAALRAAARELAAWSIARGLLNFGGQVLALGAPESSTGWLVPVAHPSRRDSAVVYLRVRDRSVSTSGQGERPGHLLDPRTGEPVPAWGSVTVVARDAAVADIVSTGLFVLGPDEGMRWAAGRADLGVLFLIERNGTLERRANPAMQAYLEQTRFGQDTTTIRNAGA